jgi:acetyl-CoA C-acetyltransferase
VTAELDPRTPVVVGVRQASERLGEPGYQRRSPVELAADAARDALADTGADPAAVASAIDTVAGVRQFENSTPDARAPLGRSDNYPRSVAGRIGARPARAVLEISGGQAPQHLVNEFAAAIAAGDSEVVLLFGAEAISTIEHYAKAPREERPDFAEHAEGSLEDRGYGLAGIVSRHLAAHGLTDAPSQYALAENDRRARRKETRATYAAAIGELFSPFTKVAAANPHASAPHQRTAEELTTPTGPNRPIADPYTRYIVARDKVNQGAAVLLMSVAAARRLGVPEDRWVFLRGHADLRERSLMERADLSASPAAVLAARHALEIAGITADDLATIDLYSCFPVPVFNICDGLGLAPGDPRGLTLTGGLPFFGGAGNNYSMHAIAETVGRARSAPGSFGFVGANGGVMSKYSAGVYSTASAPWMSDNSKKIQAEVDGWPAPEEAVQADGWATIETYTVKHSRDGKRTGIVIGRLEADGRRFVAQGEDEDLLALLTSEEPVGGRVFTHSFGVGNRVTTSDARMQELFPPESLVLRDRYEHVLLRRDGHLLEVTINRPAARNSLHPMANDELDHVFSSYFADDELWVAILTGAGEQAFSAGNDLVYTASGKPFWTPKNGFGGLTRRPRMPKPVIAAVNGYAMGGGCEIALACHLVVADPGAQFALSEVKVGVVAGEGGLVRLPRTVPPKVATEMILTGRRISAAEAHRYGLVNRVTEPGQALEGARALAAEILDASPTSVRISLQVMEETRGIMDVVDAVAHQSAAIDELLVSEDMAEGVTAFAQKRHPVWRNR